MASIVKSKCLPVRLYCFDFSETFFNFFWCVSQWWHLVNQTRAPRRFYTSVSILEVLNNIMKNLFIIKFSDFKSVLVKQYKLTELANICF